MAVNSLVAPVLTLKDAVQQAVTSNPEVLARWHAIQAAEGERDAARGGLLPRLDVSAGVGPERRTSLGDYNRRSTTITLTQLLYDGFATYGELQRLDATTRVRMFEFFDASETVALDAARAYFDVLRFRDLVRLAEQNFVEHRAVFAQTERRVNARVARAVDLEQVTGRLALAEANLLTEVANLHDTTARFQRIVGRLPTAEMPTPAHLAREIPADASTALVRAQERHPALMAAVESVRASQAALDTRSGAYRPRLDLRVRRDTGSNYTGTLGHSSNTAAELVLSWNLFNGFADQGRDRQFASQLNVAKDLRDKTCRDLRQTVLIAFNDVGKLRDQLEFLVAHRTSIGNALIAYRMQFDIGQRTLLDLLDTENELFQAQRAVANATQDLNIAYARTQQGQGMLLRALDLTGLKSGGEAELERWAIGSDAARSCPVEPITVPREQREVLMQRAVQSINRANSQARERMLQQEVAQSQPQGAATARPAGASPALSAPPPVPAAAARPTPPVATVGQEQDIRQALEGWRAAWVSRNQQAYLDSYAPAFRPAGGASRESWEQRRRAMIGKARDVNLAFIDPRTSMTGTDRATTVFVQQYQSASFQDVVTKTVEWERVDGRWRIVSELTAPAPATGR